MNDSICVVILYHAKKSGRSWNACFHVGPCVEIKNQKLQLAPDALFRRFILDARKNIHMTLSTLPKFVHVWGCIRMHKTPTFYLNICVGRCKLIFPNVWWMEIFPLIFWRADMVLLSRLATLFLILVRVILITTMTRRKSHSISSQ